MKKEIAEGKATLQSLQNEHQRLIQHTFKRIRIASRIQSEKMISRRMIKSKRGVLNDGRFQRGLIDIPLVFSDAYMLADTEVQKIFEFSSDLTTSVCIGSINDYKEEKLFISANSLFASHIFQSHIDIVLQNKEQLLS